MKADKYRLRLAIGVLRRPVAAKQMHHGDVIARTRKRRSRF